MGGVAGCSSRGVWRTGMERGVVDALQVPLVVELIHPVEDIHVRLVGGSYNQLGGLTHGAAVLLLAEPVNPFHGG